MWAVETIRKNRYEAYRIFKIDRAYSKVIKLVKLQKFTKIWHEISIPLIYINFSLKICIMTSLHHIYCLFRNDKVFAYLRYLSV